MAKYTSGAAVETYEPTMRIVPDAGAELPARKKT